MDDLPRDKVRPDDPFSLGADEWDAMAADVEAIAGVVAAPPLFFTSGRTLADATPRPSWFRLSGSSSPYGGQQVVRVGGAWVDAAYSCPACLVEANARAGLDGKVVRAWPGSPGEFVFQYVRRGVPYVVPSGYPCTPCDIPRQDLHLSFRYAVPGSTATITPTLAYTAGSPPQWTTGLITLATYNDIGPCFSTLDHHQFTVGCSSGNVYMNHRFYCDGGTPYDYFYYMSDSVYSCSPWSAHWTGSPLLFGDREAILTT